nr:hypothetical protein [Tanacetum cinerariifolium]
NSSSEIAKLTHAVNQQTSAVTTAMTTILKQFQATPPPASVKVVKEICVTCGGAHPYYQCLAAGGNTFPELRDNIQEYVAAAAVNYNQGNSIYRPLEDTLTDQDLAEYTIKVPPPLIQKSKPHSQRDFVLHINITLVDALILIPKYQKMLKDLLSNKEKLLELANTPLNEKCSAKKLGLPKLISTRMTLELANRAICTSTGIARDVFVPVGMFTFPTNFVIVDYDSDPRVPLILGRPFLWTARALLDVHREETILHDGFLEDLFSTNHQSGNRTFSSHPGLTSLEVKDDILDPEGGNVLLEKLLDLDSTKDLYPPLHVNPLISSTTSSSSSNKLLEEFVDELALITFPPGNDDLQFDIESDLKEIKYLLYHDPIKDIDSILKNSIDQSNLADLNDNLVDSMPEMFTDEHALDYSSPPLYDEYDDDLFKVESDTKNAYDDPFDSKGEKIKESELLVDELDLPFSFFLPSMTRLSLRIFQEKIKKKLAISQVSLMLEGFDPPLYELPFFKEVPRSKLSFSYENEEKVFKPGIHTSEKVHSSLIT